MSTGSAPRPSLRTTLVSYVLAVVSMSVFIGFAPPAWLLQDARPALVAVLLVVGYLLSSGKRPRVDRRAHAVVSLTPLLLLAIVFFSQTSNASLGILLAYALLLLALWEWVSVFGVNLTEAGFSFRINPAALPLAIVIGLSVAVLEAVVTDRLGVPSLSIGAPLSWTLPIVVLIATAEEFFFRGAILSQLSDRVGKGQGLVLASVLSATPMLLAGDVFRSMLSLVFSVLLGLTYLRARNVAVPVAMHVAHDLLLFGFL